MANKLVFLISPRRWGSCSPPHPLTQCSGLVKSPDLEVFAMISGNFHGIYRRRNYYGAWGNSTLSASIVHFHQPIDGFCCLIWVPCVTPTNSLNLLLDTFLIESCTCPGAAFGQSHGNLSRMMLALNNEAEAPSAVEIIPTCHR